MGQVQEAWEDAVWAFRRRIADNRVNLHGFMVIQGDRTVAEHYYLPFGPDSLHRMFSVGKSFVSLGVGLMAREGLVGLDDRICDHFLEKLPQEGPHPWLAELTIRQMLAMNTCYSRTTYAGWNGPDWVTSFFRSRPDHYPGTNFCYDTSSSHTLTALVEKLTGKKLLDYLRDRAFREIGFGEAAYMIPDPEGVSQGGSGLVCTLRDLAAVACLCRDWGWHRGRELLPEWYLRQATACQTATVLQPVIDEQQGYGYMFWQCRHGGYCMYGMGGQLALVFPEQGLVFVTMGDTQGCPSGLQMIYDAFYDTVFKQAAGRKPVSGGLERQKPAGMGTEEIPDCIPVAEGEKDSPLAMAASGRRWHCEPNPMGWKWIQPDFADGCLQMADEDGVKEFRFGWQQWVSQTFPGTEYQAVASGAWPRERTFLLRLYVIQEAFCHVYLELVFREDDRLGIRMTNTAEPFLKKYGGYMAAYPDMN